MKKITSTILITIFFSILSIITFLALELFAETKITDTYTKLLTQKTANENVVMVMIDQKSIDRIRFPWKRKLYANIIEYLNDYGHAKVVTFDSLISSPDNDFPESDEYFFNTISKYNNFIGAFNSDVNVPSESALNEEYFNKIAVKSAITVDYQKDYQPAILHKILKLRPEYIDSVSNFGQVATPHDIDTYVRSVFPILRIGDSSFPSLALASYIKYKNIDKFVLTDKYFCSADNCQTLKLPIKAHTPFGPKIRLNWYKPIDTYVSHKTYSAIDILDSYDLIKSGQPPIINPEIFDGKIVIIGAAARVKSLEDIKSTPIINHSHAGADIQATAISNFLDNSAITEISFTQKVALAFAICLLSILIISILGLNSSLITLGIMIVGYIATSILLFTKGIIIQTITPPILIILVISASYICRFLIEGHKKEQIQNAMGLYLSKDIMKSVVKNIDNIQLGGKRANITVLFADIRGFTTISEQLSAEEVTEILNEYFTAVEPIIRKHKGVLNKFIGDAVLAIFGEPIQDKNHALNAVLCANEMQQVMSKIQRNWDETGKPHIEIGIAINTGEAFVGNIGSPERIEYTVIGDTVNTASRIESYNKVYKTKLLISESTYEKVNRICDVIKIREVSIRGKSKKINIYEDLRVTNNNDNK
ncbi:adenylate/guanylate cyclase domain-containing protein [bacterium]|nr:adenylate/guanylate cyclase domain-containing protein [bacterium]